MTLCDYEGLRASFGGGFGVPEFTSFRIVTVPPLSITLAEGVGAVWWRGEGEDGVE